MSRQPPTPLVEFVLRSHPACAFQMFIPLHSILMQWRRLSTADASASAVISIQHFACCPAHYTMIQSSISNDSDNNPIVRTIVRHQGPKGDELIETIDMTVRECIDMAGSPAL